MDYNELLQSIKTFTRENANANFDYYKYKSNKAYGYVFKIVYNQPNFQSLRICVYSVSELEFLAQMIYDDLWFVADKFYRYMEQNNLYFDTIDENSYKQFLYDIYTVIYMHLFNASNLQ